MLYPGYIGEIPLGEALLASIEVQTRVLFGFREPTTDGMSRLDYDMVTCQTRPR